MNEKTLIEYLQGHLDENAAKEVETWIHASESNTKMAQDIYFLLFVDKTMRAKAEIDVNKAFNEFKAKYQNNRRRKTRTNKIWQRVAAVAAIAILTILSGAFITLTILENNAQPMTVSTNLGERAHIVLPDGTKVWLNACSNLQYKKSYFSRKRKAILEGEAYFEVTHNTKYPFIVASENTQIKVLGTKFNVRCNEDENYISATLMEGAIAFKNSEARVNVKLNPGEEVFFDKINKKLHLTHLSTPKDAMGWIQGRLIFENASLKEIAKDLERHYNVRIHFANEKAEQIRFNAEFEITDNIYQILSILALTDKFDYTIEKRDVTISSK